MSKHKHKYGPWVLHNPGALPDKEFIKGLTFPPFWYQSCGCGYENWIRNLSKPLASFKFNQMWRARRL